MLIFYRCWSWLRDHWKTVLLGVVTLGISLIVGRALRRTPAVVNPQLLEAEKVREDSQAVEDAQRAQAEAERQRDLAAVQVEHADAIAKLTEKQKAQVEELSADPEKLNSFLLSVGKETRR